MHLTVASDRAACGGAVASFAATRLRAILAERGRATIIVAAGAAQFELQEALVAEPDIAWEKVTALHLDEYVGLSIAHAASFPELPLDRFHRKFSRPLQALHYIAGDGDPRCECTRLNALLLRNRRSRFRPLTGLTAQR